MAKKATQTLGFDGPPLPTLYSRPTLGDTARAAIDKPWNVYDGAWPPNLVTTRPNFAEAEAYIRESHQDWRRRRDKGEAA